MARHREYELRLTVDPGQTEHLVAHRLIRPSLRHRQIGRLVSTYFDTPQSHLQARRFGLRIRRAEHAVTHTLKQSGTSLVDRGEWERVDDDRQPNIVWLRQTPLAQVLREDGVADALGPRFTVDVTRTTFPLKHQHAAIEAALDQGVIRTDGLSLPLCELELEIKRGEPEAALDLARKLARDLPLTLSLASKAERGYGVSDLTWGRPSDAFSPKLTRRMTIAQAFESIVQTCLNAFLKNVALIRTEEDGEALHKSRIALRHLRAASQLFEPALRRKRFAKLRKEIRWLSGRLGSARDADVFQAGTFEPAARHGDLPGAKPLALEMAAERERAHRRLRKALRSARARLLYLDLLAFSSDGIRRKARSRRYRPYVRKALADRRRKLLRRAKGLSHKSTGELHAVRKAAKMLRYDLDLFAGARKLMPRRRMRDLGGHLRTVQKSLGEIQDQEAVRARLRTTVLASLPDRSDRPPDMIEAAARLAAAPVARKDQLRRARKAFRAL